MTPAQRDRILAFLEAQDQDIDKPYTDNELEEIRKSLAYASWNASEIFRGFGIACKDLNLP